MSDSNNSDKVVMGVYSKEPELTIGQTGGGGPSYVRTENKSYTVENTGGGGCPGSSCLYKYTTLTYVPSGGAIMVQHN